MNFHSAVDFFLHWGEKKERSEWSLSNVSTTQKKGNLLEVH